MTTPPKPIPLCKNCANLSKQQSGATTLMICGLDGVNAYTERANPNGCGPTGQNYAAASG